MSPGPLPILEEKSIPLQGCRMRVSVLNSPDFAPPRTVSLLDIAPHLGLIVFTVLTAAVSLYLIYTMLRPDAF
jgi:F subunit of K+-transporting ATPase (Potass_KdpF)